MNLDFLSNYIVPVIIGICLVVGYILKHWIEDVDNKIIPTVCAGVGLILAMWINYPTIDAEVVLMGLASGLASTGLHQAFKQFMGVTNGVDNNG